MNRRSFLSLAATFGAAGALVLAACGDDTDSGDATADGAATGSSIVIDGAWARTSPMMADAGAAYLTITSPVDDAVLAASVDAAIAGTVELHETRMVETSEEPGMSDTTMGDMSDTTMGGMSPTMEMVQVDRIELPAGEAVALAPGGLHVMLLDLPAPLELGQTFVLTLTLDQGGEQQVEVTVRDEAP